MGLLVLAGLLVFGVVGAATLCAVVIASFRSRSVPLFWIASVLLGVALPFVLSGSVPTSSGGEYGQLSHFLDGAFSWSNALIVCGGLLSLALSFSRNEFVRIASATSWGFLASFVVRIAILM